MAGQLITGRSGQNHVARIVATCLILSALGIGSSRAEGNYQLGAGKNIGPVNIAGYSNLEADIPRAAPDELSLDLSLLLSGHFSRYLNPFMEAEIDDWTLARESGGAGSGNGVIERLYDDIDLTPSATLRLGKMLTPAGEWNLIHAPPLVWTVTRPLSTYYSFPEFVSGISLNFRPSFDGFWDLQFYAQPGRDLFEKPAAYQPRQYSRVAGIDVRYSRDLLSQNRLGMALQRAQLPQSGGSQILFSIYGGISTGPIRWSFQVDTTDIRGEAAAIVHDHERGGYLQAVYAVTEHWFAVAQGERFQSRDYRLATTRRLLGMVYRPRSAISWKLDYLDATGAPVGSPTGVYAAWAVLF